MVSVRVVGASDLAKCAGALNQADPMMRRALTKTLRRTARRGVDKVRDKAEETMPHAGGMNTWLKDAKLGVRISTSGKNAGLRIVASKVGHDIANIDRGSLRHPLFGQKRFWYEQGVQPGFFSQTLEDERDEITADLQANLQEFIALLRRSGS